MNDWVGRWVKNGKSSKNGKTSFSRAYVSPNGKQFRSHSLAATLGCIRREAGATARIGSSGPLQVAAGTDTECALGPVDLVLRDPDPLHDDCSHAQEPLSDEEVEEVDGEDEEEREEDGGVEEVEEVEVVLNRDGEVVEVVEDVAEVSVTDRADGVNEVEALLVEEDHNDTVASSEAAQPGAGVAGIPGGSASAGCTRSLLASSTSGRSHRWEARMAWAWRRRTRTECGALR